MTISPSAPTRIVRRSGGYVPHGSPGELAILSRVKKRTVGEGPPIPLSFVASFVRTPQNVVVLLASPLERKTWYPQKKKRAFVS